MAKTFMQMAEEAMAAVDAGYDVVGFDTAVERVKALNRGVSYVEDVDDDEITDAPASGRFRAVSSAAEIPEFDIAVISVPTPLREGTPDLSYIKLAAR